LVIPRVVIQADGYVSIGASRKDMFADLSRYLYILMGNETEIVKNLRPQNNIIL
jgi:hypothetical protein